MIFNRGKKGYFKTINSRYFSSIHLQPYIRERFGNNEGEFSVTEDISSRTLALPFRNNLSEEEVSGVLDTLQRVIETIG